MSTYNDIATGYNNLSNIAEYGLVYTCNCGWLDLGHMNPTSNNPVLGAQNLWMQLNASNKDAMINWGYHYVPEFRRYNYPQSVLSDMRRDRRARFPDGKTGKEVISRQEMPMPVIGKTGYTGRFLVKHNLPKSQLEQIALSIFLIVSYRFETFQHTLESGGIANWLSQKIKGKSYDSGFSQEDLVSNLIGFYIGIGKISKSDVFRLCHPVSQETAGKIWKEEGPVGQRKNRTTKPDFAASTAIDNDRDQICQDDCIGQPRSFPSIFSSIRPIPPGKLWVPLRS